VQAVIEKEGNGIIARFDRLLNHPVEKVRSFCMRSPTHIDLQKDTS
jgi:hypothetical protein